MKIGEEHGGGTEKRRFGIPKWLANPCDGRTIARTTSKTQFDAMNIKSNGKSQFIFAAAFGVLLLASGCVSSTFTPIGSASLAPLSTDLPVYVYTSEQEVNKPFKAVGLISYTNPGKYQVLSVGDAIPALKEQARKAGANGIIILDTRTVKSGIISTGVAVEAKAILVEP